MITNDNTPLFLQIKAWIEDHILRDEWQSGSQLPSVRELSAEFGVNPNTIARTYERLTLDGTVRSARGVGFFVAEEAKSAIIKQRKEEFYNEQMPAFIQQMLLLGITPNEIQEQYNKHLSNEDK